MQCRKYSQYCYLPIDKSTPDIISIDVRNLVLEGEGTAVFFYEFVLYGTSKPNKLFVVIELVKRTFLFSAYPDR